MHLWRRLCHASHPSAGGGGEKGLGHRGGAHRLLRRGTVHPRYYRGKYRHLHRIQVQGNPWRCAGHPGPGLSLPCHHHLNRRLPVQLCGYPCGPACVGGHQRRCGGPDCRQCGQAGQVQLEGRPVCMYFPGCPAAGLLCGPVPRHSYCVLRRGWLCGPYDSRYEEGRG